MTRHERPTKLTPARRMATGAAAFTLLLSLALAGCDKGTTTTESAATSGSDATSGTDTTSGATGTVHLKFVEVKK